MYQDSDKKPKKKEEDDDLLGVLNGSLEDASKSRGNITPDLPEEPTDVFIKLERDSMLVREIMALVLLQLLLGLPLQLCLCFFASLVHHIFISESTLFQMNTMKMPLAF